MPDTLDRDTSRYPDNLNPFGELFGAARKIRAPLTHPTMNAAATLKPRFTVPGKVEDRSPYRAALVFSSPLPLRKELCGHISR